jgi:hypothetical protein
LTLLAVEVAVVQIAVPGLVCPAGLPYTPPVTGAGASTPLWVTSIGWMISSSSAEAGAAQANGSATTTAAAATSDRDIRYRMRRIGGPPSAAHGRVRLGP